MTGSSGPTGETYRGFQEAFDVFNRELFAGALPACMITLRTIGKAKGHFSPDRFVHLADVTTSHEIALDPRRFADRTAVEVLSTLAHEMCHLQQAEHGTPSRGGYHNREWVGFMDAIGLVASNTGQPGGRQTGQQMTHYINPGGPFETLATGLVDSGRFVLTWADIEGFLVDSTELAAACPKGAAMVRAKRSGGRRTKYVCPSCGAAVWGRAGLLIACGDGDHGPQWMNPTT